MPSATQPTNHEFLKITEVAVLLHLSPTTIWRHVRSGRIKAIKIGRSYRIRRTDFEALLAAAEVAPVASNASSLPEAYKDS